jgi:transcriptional regulator with XRE-family HTH domain
MRRIRLNQGLTQQKAADLAHVEYKHFQHIETGRWPNVTLETVQKIADALQVKPWELICEVPVGDKGRSERKRGVRTKSRSK